MSNNKKDQPKAYNSFAEFYPFYLGEHMNPTNRLLHVVGTSIGIMTLAYLLYNQKYSFAFLALVPGYSCAWIGHFVFEKNKPATFKYPFYSFAGDFRMLFDVLTGRQQLFPSRKN